MKYPPKQTRSTCHCRVFINQKTNTSDIYSKTKYEEVQWFAVTSQHDFQYKATESTSLRNSSPCSLHDEGTGCTSHEEVINKEDSPLL